ncbi:Aste57867_8627 [Aphanomyces stellatus]|uniref:Aste57867_8627 protein n=1 Tax=Aphanomyces stellatus TaxID=120398 RepID=A0A485KKR2_9STRA|nr:hypothetical protein As57867_008593 [Aphanomyces stellatus]VFT85513.1 Aste57867_8627 [Aphanomyces stellatus]
MQWVLVEVVSRPLILSSLRAEVDRVMERHETLFIWDAIQELTFTTAVIQETLRLNTIVFQLIRRLAEADDRVPMLDGSTIYLPKGTAVDTNTAILHRNPAYWANPRSFVPDRFVPESPEWTADERLRQGRSHAFVFMLFSIGTMICFGQRFAMTQMQAVVASLVHKYEFAVDHDADVRHKSMA